MALPPPLIPDANQWIAARQAGYEQGEALRRRNLLLEAGQLAAGGGSPVTSAPTVLPSAPGSGGIDAYSNAISSIESGGRYDAIGPATRTGDRAYGKYQVMGANIPSWTEKHVGRKMTPQEFLADKNAQEKVFSGEFGGYVQKYGNPQDAASMWFSGRPAAQGAGRNDGYTSQPEYLRRFNAALGKNALIPTPVRTAQAVDPDAGIRAASNALLRGGELQAGLGLQNQISERAEKTKAQAEARRKEGEALFGELALRADTPEKWARAVEMARQAGLPVAGLEDFSAREFVTARAGKSPKYMSAGKRVFNETTGQYVPIDPNAPADEDDEFGLAPVQGTDEKGNPILYQLSKSGRPARRVEFPPNFTPTKPYEWRDVGTGFQAYDKLTNRPGPFVPKDVAGEAAQKAVGTASGEAQAMLPAAKTAVDRALETIGDLRNHPGLDAATGLSSWADPRNFTAGTDAFDFNEANKTATAETFMAAREGLKGAGQVTDFEGEEGRKSIANLKTAQTKGQYLKNLYRLERMMRASHADLQKKAAMSSGTSAPQAAPAPSGAIDEARAAISRGAPRDAVIQRLRENGIDPSGL